AHSFFFFFQAEDGIRDSSVTGVQTCALPISRPHGRLLVGPRVAHLLDLRRVRLGGSADHLMTAEAGLHRRDPRLARDGHRIVTVQAGDLILAGVDVVTEEDRLAGTLEPPRVADDGSLVA